MKQGEIQKRGSLGSFLSFLMLPISNVIYGFKSTSYNLVTRFRYNLRRGDGIERFVFQIVTLLS